MLPSWPESTIMGAICERATAIRRHSCAAQACRDDEVVCGRVELTVDAGRRLGLTPRERRCRSVQFLDRAKRCWICVVGHP